MYHLRRHHYGRRLARVGALPKSLRDDSLFITFAPVEHPKIAVAVVVEHTPEAPAVARKILDAYLLKQNTPAKTEHTGQ